LRILHRDVEGLDEHVGIDAVALDDADAGDAGAFPEVTVAGRVEAVLKQVDEDDAIDVELRAHLAKGQGGPLRRAVLPVDDVAGVEDLPILKLGGDAARHAAGDVGDDVGMLEHGRVVGLHEHRHGLAFKAGVLGRSVDEFLVLLDLGHATDKGGERAAGGEQARRRQREQGDGFQGSVEHGRGGVRLQG